MGGNGLWVGIAIEAHLETFEVVDLVVIMAYCFEV